jgi:hypothetical protein
LNLQKLFSELPATELVGSASVALDPAVALNDEVASTSSVLVLRRLLAAIDATSSIRYLLDDGVDDDDISSLSNFQPHKVAAQYRMTLDQAHRLVELCNVESLRLHQQQHPSSQSGPAATCPLQTSNESEVEDNDSEKSKNSVPSFRKPQVVAELSAPRRVSSVNRAIDRRVQVASSSSLIQLHFAAMHIALKSVFALTASVDVLSSWEDTSGQPDFDESEFYFRMKVITLNEMGAGTDADVFVTLIDELGRETNEVELDISKCELAIQNQKIIATGGIPQQTTIDLFERGSCDAFMIRPLIQRRFRPSRIRSIRGQSQHLPRNGLLPFYWFTTLFIGFS